MCFLREDVWSFGPLIAIRGIGPMCCAQLDIGDLLSASHSGSAESSEKDDDRLVLSTPSLVDRLSMLPDFFSSQALLCVLQLCKRNLNQSAYSSARLASGYTCVRILAGPRDISMRVLHV